MSWLHAVKHFVYRVWHRREAEQDLDEEVRAHFDLLVERGMVRGLSRGAAELSARVEFEGLEQVKERVREARVGSSIEAFVQDLRYAARVLRREPEFTLRGAKHRFGAGSQRGNLQPGRRHPAQGGGLSRARTHRSDLIQSM